MAYRHRRVTDVLMILDADRMAAMPQGPTTFFEAITENKTI
jgi:hypothetical protein